MSQMNLKTCFLLILLSQTILSLQFPPTHAAISLYGRFYTKETSVLYDWSCFRIQFCFNGSKEVSWLIQDTWNIYTLTIDDKIVQKMQPGHNNKLNLFSSTKAESHCVSITKITQNHYGPLASYKDSAFNGIEIDSGSLSPFKRGYKYKFQFLGDSITTAFGVLGSRNPLCMLKMKKIQNCLQSWAVHISNMFNAEYRIQAVSGKGLIENHVGITGKKMPKLFTQITDNTKPNTYKYADKYSPEVFFFFIGANDYSNILKPNPRRFIQGYKSLLQSVLYQQFMHFGKGTILINVCDTQFSSQLCDNVQAAVKEYSYAYDKNFYVEIPEGTLPKKNMGCIGHPNINGQRAIAEAIYPKVKQILAKLQINKNS